jgi:hypothetical protein
MTCSVLLQYIAAKNHIYPTKLWLLSYNNKYHDIPNLSNTAVTTETTERKVRASAVNTKARDAAVLATVAQDTAIKILKLESEGLKALSGKNNKITS